MTIDLRKTMQPTPAPARMSDMRAREAESVEVPRARSAPKRNRERAVMTLAAGVVAIVVLILLGYGITHLWGYFFGGTEREVRALVADVGEHMLLPESETPALATVTDLHALEGQAFFRNAQLGDKVLMYMISQKAIIYRPSIDRIIEVGPITSTGE